MTRFKIFIHLLILFTTPTFLAYPQANVQLVHTKKLEKNFRKEQRYHLLSYDEILTLLNEIESGKAEEKYRPKDLKRINRFLAYLAVKGALPNTNYLAIRDDIKDLLSDDEYTIVPAVFQEGASVHLCKSPWWSKTKKFVKNHKTEIITGAVVVVATLAVVGIVAASSAAACAAAGAAAPSKPRKEEEITAQNEEPSFGFSLPPDISRAIASAEDAPILQGLVNEETTVFKEFVIEDQLMQISSQGWNDLTFGEKARELGAYLAHQVYDEVSELMSVVPQLCEEINAIGSEIIPEDFASQKMEGPQEHYETFMAKSHEAIDAVFATDQAEFFTAQAKANNFSNNFAPGIIPLPGMISSNGAINAKEFSKLGKAADRAGFTKAGRNLMKHGYRKESVFPKPVGNPSQVNQHGQQVLESILKHPEKIITQYTHKLHGPVIDIEAPQLGAVRFNGDGTEMMGFLEPRWFTKNP